jgi:AcrR family transcriptional regulator
MARRPNPDERERKRLHILEVAAGEFARLGFDGANINTISELAGLGKGTVYLYASSKEQLLVDVLREIGYQLRAALDESLEQSIGAPVPQRLRALVEAFADLADEHPDFIRLQASALFGVNRRFQDGAAQVLREIVERLTASIEAEERQGAIRLISSQSLAVLLIGMLHTFALLPDALGVPVGSRSERIDFIVRVLWQGIVPLQQRALVGD